MRFLAVVVLCLSGCVTVAEHNLFVKASVDYRTAVAEAIAEIRSGHGDFVTTQAASNWQMEDTRFGAACLKAKK